MENKEIKLYRLEEVTDRIVGQRGTPEREAFEYELKLELLGKAIKTARKERHLTQEELGKLVGVQKAQISKIENNFTNARLDTILKVFKALQANVNLKVELPQIQVQL